MESRLKFELIIFAHPYSTLGSIPSRSSHFTPLRCLLLPTLTVRASGGSRCSSLAQVRPSSVLSSPPPPPRLSHLFPPIPRSHSPLPCSTHPETDKLTPTTPRLEPPSPPRRVPPLPLRPSLPLVPLPPPPPLPPNHLSLLLPLRRIWPHPRSHLPPLPHPRRGVSPPPVEEGPRRARAARG